MLCIIPARKGSKGLKNKNTKILAGKPLIVHTIKTALKCEEIKEIVITTDDEKIIQICKKIKGIKVPFKRPKYLSNDNSISIDVYLHCINFLENFTKKKYEKFCVMLPTCPIRNVKEINNAIKIFNKKKIDFLISVVETKPIQNIYKINSENKICLEKNNFSKLYNRQDLDKSFSANGSIYIFRTNKLRDYKTFITKNTYCYKMNKLNSMDIDDLDDFRLIKKLF